MTKVDRVEFGTRKRTTKRTRRTAVVAKATTPEKVASGDFEVEVQPMNFTVKINAHRFLMDEETLRFFISNCEEMLNHAESMRW